MADVLSILFWFDGDNCEIWYRYSLQTLLHITYEMLFVSQEFKT
jgi:hypothetical protein